VGFPIGHRGLETLYEAAAPGLKVTVEGERYGDTADLSLEWRTPQGALASSGNRLITRSKDGALALHTFGSFTNPDFRGNGHAARHIRADLEMLRALSPHQDTRITLRAGDADNPDTGEVERVGCYAWGPLGFDFADRKHDPDPIGYSPRIWGADEERPETDLALLQEGFDAFLQNASRKTPELRDPGLQAALRDTAQAWKHPWEIAMLDVGLKLPVEVGGRSSECNLGKAYLLSLDAPAWYGCMYANRPDTPETRVAKQLLEKSISRGAA
jgi:hypothetical protein